MSPGSAVWGSNGKPVLEVTFRNHAAGTRDPTNRLARLLTRFWGGMTSYKIIHWETSVILLQ